MIIIIIINYYYCYYYVTTAGFKSMRCMCPVLSIRETGPAG